MHATKDIQPTAPVGHAVSYSSIAYTCLFHWMEGGGGGGGGQGVLRVFSPPFYSIVSVLYTAYTCTCTCTSIHTCTCTYIVYIPVQKVHVHVHVHMDIHMNKILMHTFGGGSTVSRHNRYVISVPYWTSETLTAFVSVIKH